MPKWNSKAVVLNLRKMLLLLEMPGHGKFLSLAQETALPLYGDQDPH